MKKLFFLIALVFCNSIFCSAPQSVPKKEDNFEKEDVLIVFQKDMFKGIESKYPLMSVNNTVSIWPILTINLEVIKSEKEIIKVEKAVHDDKILIILSGPIKGLQFNLPNFVKLTFNIKSKQAYLVTLHKSSLGTDTLSLQELSIDRYRTLKKHIAKD